MSDSKPLNPWHYKPWWCQPWSILLVGILIPAGGWLLTHKIWLLVVLACPILLWWYYFLLIWPRLMRESGILESLPKRQKNSV